MNNKNIYVLLRGSYTNIFIDELLINLLMFQMLTENLEKAKKRTRIA